MGLTGFRGRSRGRGEGGGSVPASGTFGVWVSDNWRYTSLDIMGRREVEDLTRDLVRKTEHKGTRGIVHRKNTCGTLKGCGHCWFDRPSA